MKIIKDLMMGIGTTKGDRYSEIYSDRPLVIVYTTYAWQMPKILRNFIQHTTFAGNKNVYFVVTCGDSMGNMSKYLSVYATPVSDVVNVYRIRVIHGYHGGTRIRMDGTAMAGSQR